MTFTRRIRLFLALVAILPVMIVMAMIWNQFSEQSEQDGQRLAQSAITRYQILDQSLNDQLAQSINDYTIQNSFKRTVRELSGDKISRLPIDPRQYSIDFVELVDIDQTVRASFHRPGLLGEKIDRPIPLDSLPKFFETIEYDLNGPHAAIVSVSEVGSDLLLYAGRYFDRQLLDQMTDMIGSPVTLILEPDPVLIYASMARQKLYQTETGYETVLAGSDSAGFYLIAGFERAVDNPAVMNLMGLAGLVGLVSVIISIVVGMFITGRAKREIDNLVQATERVSKGDLNTPIMAYEEGEFSKLAESFSQMMVDLKTSQADLAESEKIAAWQTIGRKIAHEIKNPMTPIAISADDLRRSYHEKLPDFDKILDQTTGTIKSEVDRLVRLLDQFVGFAKMAPPNIKPTDMARLTDELRSFYHREITEGRLTINCSSGNNRFAVDRDNIWQVMINLIKNGLESNENANVAVRVEANTEQLSIVVEDNGPGFPENILANSFQPQLSTKKHGSGLGLVICHRIIRDHHGRLKIYSLTEGGAGVSVSIPA